MTSETVSIYGLDSVSRICTGPCTNLLSCVYPPLEVYTPLFSFPRHLRWLSHPLRLNYWKIVSLSWSFPPPPPPRFFYFSSRATPSQKKKKRISFSFSTSVPMRFSSRVKNDSSSVLYSTEASGTCLIYGRFSLRGMNFIFFTNVFSISSIIFFLSSLRLHCFFAANHFIHFI